jgi:hypothetical protein
VSVFCPAGGASDGPKCASGNAIGLCTVAKSDLALLSPNYGKDQAILGTQPASPNGAMLNNEPLRIKTLAMKGDASEKGALGDEPERVHTYAIRPDQPVAVPQGAAVLPATMGGYSVQITSQRSEADAQASYRAVQLKSPDVLGSLTPSIRRADLGEKGIYYRAVIGPFAAAEEAGKLCTILKSAGGQCVVQRN